MTQEVGIPERKITPISVMDFGWTGENEFEPGETIDSIVWTVPLPLAKVDEAIDAARIVATVLVSAAGAPIDTVHDVDMTLTTVGGTLVRTYYRTIRLRVVEKIGGRPI